MKRKNSKKGKTVITNESNNNGSSSNKEPNPEYPSLCLHKGNVYQQEEMDNLRFFRQIPLPEVPIGVEYVGPKIPLRLWHQAVSFFELSYEETNGETQLRIFFNKKLNEWKLWAFPQFSGMGMTTEEIPDHPNRRIQDQQIGAGFVVFGTIHHHCNMTAFQSGTDKNNEYTQNGLHITVGKLRDKAYDLHGRVVIRGQQHDVVWAQWFEMSENNEQNLDEVVDRLEWFKGWEGLFPMSDKWETDPDKLREIFAEWELRQPPDYDVEIPDEWMSNLIPKAYPGGFNTGNHNHNIGGPHCEGGYFMRSQEPREPNDSEGIKAAEQVISFGEVLKIRDYRVQFLVEGIKERRGGGEAAVKEHMTPKDDDEKAFCDKVEHLINTTTHMTGSRLHYALKDYLLWMDELEKHARGVGL